MDKTYYIWLSNGETVVAEVTIKKEFDNLLTEQLLRKALETQGFHFAEKP